MFFRKQYYFLQKQANKRQQYLNTNNFHKHLLLIKHKYLFEMKKNQSYTKLYKLIQRCILNHQNLTCKQIQSKIYNQTIILNSLGDEQTFLTDLYCSIQYVCKNKNLQQETNLMLLRDPFNERQNNYYFISKNKWHPFNCKQQFISKQLAIDTPHHPKFYFQQHFEHLKTQKSQNKSYFLPCFRIKITRWRIQIVNINKSGWFAPIIEVIDFKKDMDSVRQDFKQISLILYQEKVKETMEKLRLQELRCKKIPKFPYQEHQISLFYFLKDQRKSKPTKRLQNIFKTDTKGDLLKYNNAKPKKYVLFGQKEGIQGILTLQSEINIEAIKVDRLKSLNIESLRVLFSSIQMNRVKPSMGPDLWSSSDSDQQFEENNQKKPIMVSKNQENQDSDDQDPLRSLYIKQFKQLDLSEK